MALPNPSMSFSPFAILTAEEMNDLVENIESLSTGTGLAAGAVKAPNIDWTTYAIRWARSSVVTTQSATVTVSLTDLPAGVRGLRVSFMGSKTANTPSVCGIYFDASGSQTYNRTILQASGTSSTVANATDNNMTSDSNVTYDYEVSGHINAIVPGAYPSGNFLSTSGGGFNRLHWFTSNGPVTAASITVATSASTWVAGSTFIVEAI